MTRPKDRPARSHYIQNVIKRKLYADLARSYLSSSVLLHDAIGASGKRLEAAEVYDADRGATRWTLFASGLLADIDERTELPVDVRQTILCTRSEPAVLATLFTMQQGGCPLQILFNHSSGRDLVRALSEGLDRQADWVITAEEPLFASSLKSKDRFVSVLPIHPSPQKVIVEAGCTTKTLNVLHAPKESTALAFVAALRGSYPREVAGVTFRSVATFDYIDWARQAIDMGIDDALIIWDPAADLLLRHGLVNPFSQAKLAFKCLYTYDASISIFGNTARLGVALDSHPAARAFLRSFVLTWKSLILSPERAWEMISSMPEVIESLERVFSRIGNELPYATTVAEELGQPVLGRVVVDPQPPTVREGSSANTHLGSVSFDVCIVCALAEEARAVLDEMKRSNLGIDQGVGTRSSFSYRSTTMPNVLGEPLRISVSWLPRYGPLEMTLHMSHVLEELQPRLTIMTGICAGDRRSVALGDLVIAERTFTYDAGKVSVDEQGVSVHLHDTMTYQLDSNILQFVAMFDDWRVPVSVLERPMPSVRESPISCHVKTMASGNAVRADRPFDIVRVPVRGAIAIDMEGAAFSLVSSRSSIPWLIVKGVSDYADESKDDAYHEYAAHAAAVYALSFASAFVNFDRPRRVQSDLPR